MKKLILLTFFCAISVIFPTEKAFAISDLECAEQYRSLEFAGVRLQSVWSTESARPDCSKVVYLIAACPVNTRLELDDPTFSAHEGKIAHFTKGSGQFMCVNRKVISSGFRPELCNLANYAGKSRYRLKDGKAASDTVSTLSPIMFRPSNDNRRCECAPRGNPGLGFMDCTQTNPWANYMPPQPPQQTVAENQPRRPRRRPVVAPVNSPRQPTTPAATADQECAPGTKPVVDNEDGSTVCEEDAPSSVSSTATVETPQERERREQEERQALQAARDCIDSRFTSIQQTCSASKDNMMRTCDEKRRNDATSRQMAGVVSQGNAAANANTGAQSKCFGAAALAYGAQTGISALSDECKAQADSCKMSCGEESVNTLAEGCADKIGERAEARNYLNQRKDALLSSLRATTSDCDKGSQQANGYADAANVLARSLRDSAICACKLSNSGALAGTNAGGGCDSLPTVVSCQENPSQPQCMTYSVFATCAVGSPTYNAQACSCFQTTNGSTCLNRNQVTLSNNSVFQDKGPATMGSGVSGFAGGVSTGGNAPKAGTLNFNSSGGQGADGTAINLRQGDQTGGGGGPTRMGTAAAGGGLGGGNGNLADPNTAGAGGDPNAGANAKNNATFNRALTTTGGNTAGFKGKSGAVVADEFSKNAKDVDPSKFKPKGKLRGIAGYDDDDMYVLGKKNMDIFKMMTLCTSGESCKSNVNGYITDP